MSFPIHRLAAAFALAATLYSTPAPARAQAETPVLGYCREVRRLNALGASAAPGSEASRAVDLRLAAIGSAYTNADLWSEAKRHGYRECQQMW